MQDYEDKTIHYGFFFAVPNTGFTLNYNDNLAQRDTAYSIYSTPQAGFKMGFVLNARIDDRFDFRVTPTVAIYGRSVDYRFPNRDFSELRESTWVEIPFLMKLKSERRENTRMYAVAGLTLGMEANVRSKTSTSTGRLNTKTMDITLDYGVGLEQFFRFFKFSPEIRFSHGLLNMFEPSITSPYAQSIQRMTSHTVTLYLMFE